MFAQALYAHGVFLRTAGVEAAEQIGRCERHGGIFKQNLSLVVTACGIEGKAAMKMAAATCVSAKNELVRQGGIAPSQWVLGKFPRRVGHMLEDEELGQLGVLEHQTDSATEFGMKAKWRLESMKAFVRQDCSFRLARARLQQSGPTDMEFKAEEWKQKRMRALGESQKLQKRGKLLQYAKEPEHVQGGLDEARLAEWKKWQKHSAADVISAQEAAPLVMEGADEVGTQWTEVDRNEKVRVESRQAGDAKYVLMNLKSGLVALGNQEKGEVRSDSLTADAEGIHLVFCFASSRKAKEWCGDLESTYFTGERTSRVLLLRQPRSGLPGLKPDDRL